MKLVDTTALTIKYKPDEDKEDIIEVNKSGVGIESKNTLLNYTKEITKLPVADLNLLP